MPAVAIPPRPGRAGVEPRTARVVAELANAQEAGLNHHFTKLFDLDALLAMLSAGTSGKPSEGGSAPEKSPGQMSQISATG